MVENLTRGTTLARVLKTARSPWDQFMGLMGRAALPSGEALLLPGTRGVHTHFMRFPIDVIFYDRDRRVLDVAHALRPWRFSAYHLRAAGAIELAEGVAQVSGTQCGDALAFDTTQGAHR